MQPYQSSSEEQIRQGELPFTRAKTVASLVGTGIAATKVLPFLNKFIPESLAIKGLNKLDPRFGSFINTAKEQGGSWEEIKDFIKEKMDSQQSDESRNIKDNNLIQNNSPELFKFIQQLRKRGKSIEEIAKESINTKRFQPIIDKLTKEKNSNWVSILAEMLGEDKTQPVQQQNQAAPASQMQEQPYQQQPQQMSPGIQNLTNALNAVLQSGVLK